MVGLVWTSSFGIRSLIRSLTYNTSTRVISLGVVFMEDFRTPIRTSAGMHFRAEFFLQNLGNDTSSFLKNIQTYPDIWGASTLPQG